MLKFVFICFCALGVALADDEPPCPSDFSIEAYFPHESCSKFWQCSNGVPYQHNCPGGLHFNPVLNVCDWPENAGCSGGATSAGTTAKPTTQKPTTEKPTTQSPSTSRATTPSNRPNNTCPAVAGAESVYFPDKDCTKFWQCSNGKPYQHNCPDGLHFNPVLNVCDWPENAGCSGDGTSAATTAKSTTQTPTTAKLTTQSPTTSRATTPSNKPHNPCPAVDGPDSVYFPDKDCTKFWQCSNGKPYQHNCPDGLHFNPVLNVCDWPENAGCSGGGTSAATTAKSTTQTQTTAKLSTQSPTSSSATTPSNKPHNPCPAVDGPDSVYFPDKDCTKFWQCSNGKPYQHNCPDGLHFNPVLNVCDWPENAGCSGGATSAATTAKPTTQKPTTAKPTTQTPTTAKPTSQSPTTSRATTPSNRPNNTCPAVDGPDSVYFPDKDCTKFWQCSNGKPYQHNCPDGLHFNPVLNVCDWPENAGCSGGATSAATTAKPTTQKPTTQTPTTAKPTTQSPTTSRATTPSNRPNNTCPAVDGPDSVYFPDKDCTKFWQCSNGKPYQHNCPDGLHFNPVLNVCDWPENAGCSGGATSAATTAKPTTQKPTTQTPTTAKPTTQSPTTSRATTPSNRPNNTCPAVDGPDSVYFPDEDCTKFWQCSNGKPYQHNCPDGLHFNPVLNVCDWPENAGCSGGATSAATTAKPTTQKPTTAKPTSQTPTTAKPTTQSSTTSRATTPSNRPNNTCPAVDGPDSVYFPDKDCTKFWQCSNGKPYQHNCPDGLHFNPVLNVCDWPENAGCSGGATSASTTAKPTTQKSTTAKPTTKTPTTAKPTTQSPTTSRATTPSNRPNNTCPAVDGPDSVYFPDEDCTKFWQCSNGKPYQHNCPDGLHFNPDLNVCDWPENAGCSGDATSAATTAKPTTQKPTTAKPTTASPKCPDVTTPTTTASPICPEVTTPTTTVTPICPEVTTPTTTATPICPEVTTPSTTASHVCPEEPAEPSKPNLQACDNVKCPQVDPEYPVYAPHEDCTKFCQCSNGLAYLHSCPSGLHFNPVLNVCDWPQNAGCAAASLSQSPLKNLIRYLQHLEE